MSKFLMIQSFNSQTIFTKLRDILALLYPYEESARRIVADVGIDIRYITFSTHAINNWHAILNEIIKNDRVGTLLDIVSKEYGRNQEFHDACIAYARLVNQGGHLDAFASQDLVQSKYRANIQGDVQGFVQGDNSQITMTFNSQSK